MEHEDKLPEMSFCGNCGKKLIANATYCAHCGAQIPKMSNVSVDYPVNFGYVPKTTPSEPPLRFVDHFKGVILNPREEFQKISHRPNFKQPLLLNFLISLFSITAFILLIALGKITLTFTSEFFESMGSPLPSEEFGPREFGEMFKILMMTFLPVIFIIQWLLFSAVLWVCNAIFASDLPSSERTYKKMATIVGWAQFPLIILQIVMIIIIIGFLPSGEIIYHSMFEIEAVVSVTNSFPSALVLNLVDLFVFIYGVILVYYTVKSQSSLKGNPVAISIVYGIAVYFLRVDWVLSIIISLL